MKYVNTGVVFQEIPDEVTLSINISNCPCHCIGCHSEYLWDDIGVTLDVNSLEAMLTSYADDVTCVCFMGGDGEPEEVNALAKHIKHYYPKLKVGWYSGRRDLVEEIDLGNFDYIKLGPYISRFGGLDSETTNQRMYQIDPHGRMTDITHKYWKKH